MKIVWCYIFSPLPCDDDYDEEKSFLQDEAEL